MATQLRWTAVSGGSSVLGKWPVASAIGLAATYLLIDAASYSGISAIGYLLFAFGLPLAFIRPRVGFIYFLVLVILSDDTPRDLISSGFESLLFTRLGPFSISVLWTLLLWYVGVLWYLLGGRIGKPSRMDGYVLLLGVLFALMGLRGVQNLGTYAQMFVVDASYMINTAIAYFIVRRFFAERSQVATLLAALLLALGVKAVVAIAYFVLGLGVVAGANVRVFFDSSRKILGLLVIVSFSLVWYVRDARTREKALLLVFGFAGLFHLISFASRGNLLLLIAGLLIFAFLSRRLALLQGRAVATRMLVLVFGLGAIAALSITIIRPGALAYLGWKLNTLTDLSLDADPSSAAVRVLEGINIFGGLAASGDLVWGKGLGGWVTDETLPFMRGLVGGAAYSDEHILQGRLLRPHGTHLVLLLKAGVGGALLYYGLYFAALVEAARATRRSMDPLIVAASTGLIASFPMFLVANFTSELQVLMGVALGLLANMRDITTAETAVPGARREGSLVLTGARV